MDIYNSAVTMGIDSQRYIYLVLSHTPSKFGTVIRFFSGAVYNHASIAFDEKLHQLYSFGRRQNTAPINAGLVLEYPERFSLNTVNHVGVRIYKIPVTEKQYSVGLDQINHIKNEDDKYLYNLFSVLLFPVFRGFATYKSFSCAEFVVHVLRSMGLCIDSNRPAYEYLPDDIGDCIGYPCIF